MPDDSSLLPQDVLAEAWFAKHGLLACSHDDASRPAQCCTLCSSSNIHWWMVVQLPAVMPHMFSLLGVELQSVDVAWQPQPPTGPGIANCSILLMQWSPFPCHYDPAQSTSNPGWADKSRCVLRVAGSI